MPGPPEGIVLRGTEEFLVPDGANYLMGRQKTVVSGACAICMFFRWGSIQATDIGDCAIYSQPTIIKSLPCL